jgi:hypothetical protein
MAAAIINVMIEAPGLRARQYTAIGARTAPVTSMLVAPIVSADQVSATIIAVKNRTGVGFGIDVIEDELLI